MSDCHSEALDDKKKDLNVGIVVFIVKRREFHTF